MPDSPNPVINTDIAFDTPATVATAASPTATFSDPITRAEVEQKLADLKEILSRYGIA